MQPLLPTPPPPPISSFTRYTPEKPAQNARKINFVYTNKAPPTKFENLGVNDLETFKQEIQVIKHVKTISKATVINTTQAFSGYHSQFRPDPNKSTQITQMASEKVGSWDESPGLSR